MWVEVAIFAARLSFRHLAMGIWVLFMFGVLVGWLYRWIMDDSR